MFVSYNFIVLLVFIYNFQVSLTQLDPIVIFLYCSLSTIAVSLYSIRLALLSSSSLMLVKISFGLLALLGFSCSVL